MKTWYNIKAQAPESDRAEVNILSEIGYWGVNAQQFLNDFRAIKAQNVDVFINSPGGNVVEAIAIFNGMRATGKNITIRILGIAASAASYVAMAGDKIVMPANTWMFIHNPINGIYGNAAEMREMADVLDKFGAVITQAYSARFRGEASVLADLLAAESYLTAAECLEYGFCDEVTPEIEATALFEVDRLPANVQALFKAAAPAPVPETAPPPVATGALADRIQAMAATAGLTEFVGVFVTDPAALDDTAALALVARAGEIQALAKHSGLPEMAAGLIRSRTDMAAARAALAEALEAEADATTVNTAKTSKTTQAEKSSAWSPLAQWAEIKAAKAGSNK